MGFVEDMLAAQRAAIHKAQTKMGARQRRIVGEAMVGLSHDLKRLRPGSWSFTAKTAVLNLVSQTFADLSGKQAKGVGAGVFDVTKASAGLTAEWLTELDKRYRAGKVKPLRFDTLSWWTRKAEETNRARLRMYGASFRRYGAKSVAAIEDEIGRVVLLGEPWEKARAKVWAATRKVVGDNQWMVDRIIRTEVSAVHNGIALEALREEDDDPKDRMFKVLVATFDKKTGQDSIFVHGQRRRLDENFQDDSGRLYMAPPNRPHDREIVMGWRASYGEFEAAKVPKRALKESKRAVKEPKASTPEIDALQALRAARTADINAARRSLVPPLAMTGTPEQIASMADLNFAAQQRIRMLQAERKQITASLERLRREAGSRAAQARKAAPVVTAPAPVEPKPKVAAKPKPAKESKPKAESKPKKQAMKASKGDAATDELRKEIERHAAQRAELIDETARVLGPAARDEFATLRARQDAVTKGKRGVTPNGQLVTDTAKSQAQRDAWIQSLSAEQRDAVRDWSSEQWFRTIRMVDSGRGVESSLQAVRATGRLAAMATNEAKLMLEAERKLAALREALAKAPRFEGTVSRGIRELPKGSALRKALDTPGAVLELDAVTSWSADEWTSRSFSEDDHGAYLLRVITKRGAVISDERVVYTAVEAEVMLDKGSRFRVVSSEVRKGDKRRKLVVLEEIDD